MIGYLRTLVRKQPIIALNIESETVLKFYNLEARYHELRLAHVDPQTSTLHVVLQVESLAMHLSSESAITARSSAYRSFHGSPVRNSRDSASSTRMKSKSTPTPTPNSSMYCPLTCIRLLTSICMQSMTCTSHSSTTKRLNAYQRTFLETLPQAFSISTKARYNGLLAAM